MKISQAFPAGSGPIDRTIYMFTYVNPQPGLPKLEDLLEDYWDLMPKYQVNFRSVLCNLMYHSSNCLLLHLDD